MSNQSYDSLGMSEEDIAEFERYLAVDSADIPGAGAGVNRDAHDPSHNAPRSQYFGVYNNTGNNADKFRFRSALRMGQGKNARWLNLGYFNCEIVAAMAYNVAAVNTFKKGAFLNPVSPEDADAEELKRWKELRAEHIATATETIQKLKEDGVHLRYVDLEARNAETHA